LILSLNTNMTDESKPILAELEDFLAKRGLRLTSQRRRLTEMVMSTRQHLTVDELVALAHEKRLNIGRATVYRTLDLLCQAGLVHGHDFGQGSRRYEAMFGLLHHDHMQCTQCGAIIEFACEEIERLQEQKAREHGFTLTSHRLEMFGLCSRCNPPQASRPKSPKQPVTGRKKA
jgi:Fur family ferric uptake transcriptional regulator